MSGSNEVSFVGSGDEVGPAAFDAGAPDPACRSVESTVRSGDEVGPAAFDEVGDTGVHVTGLVARTSTDGQARKWGFRAFTNVIRRAWMSTRRNGCL
jgi:hypothetical protein